MMTIARASDRVVIVGGGIAGLAVALHLAPVPVTLIVAAPLGTGASTPLAQGGVAAALGPDDRPDLHADDTLKAGAGLSDRAVAVRVAEAAPACVEWLLDQGVRLDREPKGQLALGLEAAHSRRRIVHADGDGTGRGIVETLIRNARATPSVEILEGICVTELAVSANGSVDGVYCLPIETDRAAHPLFVPARAVVLATGGMGGLYAHTTNPLGSTGSGLAIAARAGAALRDLEFVQFHPTAIAAGLDPMPLATEALRGEGAWLVDERGERFMLAVPGAELAPRDVVAQEIFARIASGRRVFLDTRAALGDKLPQRFPGVAALCRAAGIDPIRNPIPVRPAAHYHMGGIRVDGRGRSSIAGLWACGEVASTGLHGANRLASNSLLEALAYARWIAEDIGAVEAAASLRNTPRPRPWRNRPYAGAGRDLSLAEIRTLMDNHVGVVRDGSGLATAVRRLRRAASTEAGTSASARDAALVGLLVAIAAHARRRAEGRTSAGTARRQARQRDIRR
jgi:L-aspartate oxidase